MNSLNGKTVFITGASRGIGQAIALKAAADGANVAIAAKSDRRHPKLPGTIYETAEAVEAAGGRALPLKLDIRDEDAVAAAMQQTAANFGGIDILVNNASAIWLAGTEDTPMKRFDLMFGVNVRGTYVCSQAALPYLKRATNAHILNLSPPLNMDPKWFAPHVAYTLAKSGMRQCVLGMAAEFRGIPIAVNALWPRTVIATAALAMLGGKIRPENCRKPEILADSAHWILTRPATEASGNFYIDDEVLKQAGVTDFDQYAVDPGQPLITDLFLDS